LKDSKAMDRYIRGSEWRKWDLQVQTIIDDEYVSLGAYYQNFKSNNEVKWNEYTTKVGGEENALMFDSREYFTNSTIAKAIRVNNYVRNFFSFVETFNPTLSCIGITDHNYFDECLLDEFINYSKHTELKIIPGVEINVNGIHMLIYFRKFILNQQTMSDSIKTFLNSIGINSRKTNEVLTITTVDITEVISKIRENQGIFIYSHCNTPNGLFQERQSTDRTLLATTFNFSPMNILQTQKKSSCTSLTSFIDSHSDYLKSGYCFTLGSDSRSLKDVGKPDPDDNMLWIKADTTFDGLKQIIYEPEERVRIQKRSPFEDRKKVFFDEVSLEGSVNFIVPDTKFYLNRELVAVIGGRGSGKSALLDLVAFLNEEHAKADQNDKPKLIEFYRNNIELKNPFPGFLLRAKLIDKDNNQRESTKKLENLESLSLPFLYIGQEQLSLIATDDKALTLKVCELISLNFSDIEKPQLIETARNVLSEISILREEIFDIHKKYFDFRNQMGFEHWLKNYIDKKQLQKKTLSSEETKKLLEEISKQIDRRLHLRDFLIDLENLIIKIKSHGVNEEITELNKTQKILYKENLQLIPAVEFDVQEKFIKLLQKKASEEISQLIKSIEEKKIKLSTLGIKEDITALVQSIEAIQGEISIAAKDLISYEEKIKLLREKVKERNSLYVDIIKQVKLSKETIDSKFLEFTKSRDDSSIDEQELFKNVISDIRIEGAIDFKQDIFCNYILDNCVDRRKFKSAQDIKEIIAGKDRDIVKDITLDLLGRWIENDLNTFLRGENFNEGGAKKLIDYLFTSWHEFIRVKAIARLKEIPTEKLSVGQRGTLLLKIYLATASVKQIFIVDQPEDNLDNHFIMNQLVPLIKKVKKIRQIILSTHNANLVVNADAEQVVVAQLDQEENKGYISGSIENPIINKKIKDILEGGEEAFRKRESKYGFGKI
jgi:ABC-type cobalamin/Fe3+-siderophores transport system ATPase subunit